MKRPIAVILCASLLAGCGTTATIYRKNGQQDEATILRGNSTNVVVDTGAGERAIPREDITDIDHPGNVHATIGAFLLAYGILNIAVGTSQCQSKGAAFCTGVFLPATVGLGMSIWGLTIWTKSSNAARNTGPRGPELSLAPLLGLGEQKAGGGTLTLHY
jgi:hypothetical protein